MSEAVPESFSESFFALSLDLLCVIGPDGFFKQLNPAWERVLGLSIKDLLRTPMIELVHPDDVARTLMASESAQNEVGGRDFENRFCTADGSYVWLSWRFAAAPGELFFGVAREVTERKRADDELRRERAFIRQVIDAAPSLITVKDAEGRFVLANRAMGELLGGRPEALLDKRDSEIHRNPTHLDVYAANDRRVLESRETIEVDEPMTLATGEQRIFSTIKTPLVRANGELQILAISSDVTDRKRGENELIRAREQALEASRAKSQFLANMSHEIRTPMNGILGMTALALETELTQEQKDYLTAVEISGKNLLQIVNDILDLSKIEAQKLELEAIPFELARSVEESVRALAARTQEKGLELLFGVSPQLPWSVIGDPVRFRQIVTNLLGNAIKFTERGEIYVSVEPDPDSPPEAAMVRVSVEDTGEGIRKERQSRIFEAFTQEDGSTTRRFGGTGLGLTISRELVRRMGGKIWVESEPGKGSTFRFTVRLESADAEHAYTQPDLHGMRALVIDDNPRSLQSLTSSLKRWNAEPLSAVSASEAMALLEDPKNLASLPRLLIVDAVMPGQDGLTFCQQVEADLRLSIIPRILLLAPGRRIPRDELERAGVARALHKPISEASLLEAVRTALAGWATRRATVSAFALAAMVNPAPSGGSPTSPSPEGPRPPPARPPQERVSANAPIALLAEDNDINALLARKMLEKLGWRVERVANGAQAVQKLEAGRYDAVLMDVQMPTMDGYEATHHVRDREQADKLPRVPIVALTANAMKGDEVRCLQAGMDLYLTKPLGLEALRTAMNQAIELGKVQR